MQRIRDLLGRNENGEGEKELDKNLKIAKKQIKKLKDLLDRKIDSSKLELDIIETLDTLLNIALNIDHDSPVHTQLKEFLAENNVLIYNCLHDYPQLALERQIYIKSRIHKTIFENDTPSVVATIIQMNINLLNVAHYNEPTIQSIRSFVNGLNLLERFIRETYSQNPEDNQEYVEFILGSSEAAIDLFSKNTDIGEQYIKAWNYRLKLIQNKQKVGENPIR